MGLFNFGKNKPPKELSEKAKEKLINKIKKNKVEINKLEAEAQMQPLSKGKTKKYLKLKEDNVKMAKQLIIKNGRLEKVEVNEQQGAPQVPQPPQAPQQTQAQAPPQAPPQYQSQQTPMPPAFDIPPRPQGGDNMVGEPQLNAQMRQAPPQAPPQQEQQEDPYVKMLHEQEARQRAHQEALMRQRQMAVEQARAAQFAQQQVPPHIQRGPSGVVPVSIY